MDRSEHEGRFLGVCGFQREQRTLHYNDAACRIPTDRPVSTVHLAEHYPHDPTLLAIQRRLRERHTGRRSGLLCDVRRCALRVHWTSSVASGQTEAAVLARHVELLGAYAYRVGHRVHRVLRATHQFTRESGKQIR